MYIQGNGDRMYEVSSGGLQIEDPTPGGEDFVLPERGDVLDGQGAYAIPGLIDLHFHGCRGIRGVRRCHGYSSGDNDASCSEAEQHSENRRALPERGLR